MGPLCLYWAADVRAVLLLHASHVSYVMPETVERKRLEHFPACCTSAAWAERLARLGTPAAVQGRPPHETVHPGMGAKTNNFRITSAVFCR